MIEPPHPGETTKEDYLLPLGMSVNRRATLGPPLRYQRRVPAESPVALRSARGRTQGWRQD